MSTFRKKVFSGTPVKCVFVYDSNNSDSVGVGNAGFPEIKDHSFKTTRFQKNFCYVSFRYVTILRKKVFSGAPVKYIFLDCANNSDSVVFGNEGFGKVKDHSLTTTHFQKIFLLRRFRYVSSLRKKIFLVAPVKCFFLYGSNNSDCVVFGNTIFRKIKDNSLRTTPFQKKFSSMEGWDMCLPYVKRYFRDTSEVK